MKPFARVVDVGMFYRSVVLLVGDFAELSRLLKEDSLSLGDDEVRVLKKQWPGVRKGIAACYENEFAKSEGCCFVVSGDIYIHMREWSSAVLVHELHHAERRLSDLVGQNDEETGAYFVEYVFQELAWDKKGKRKWTTR